MKKSNEISQETTENIRITKNEYLQLVGLKTLALMHIEKLNDLKTAAEEILKPFESEDQTSSWAEDLIWDNGTTVERVCRALKLKVKNK